MAGELVAVTVEIEVDGAWEEITADARTTRPIRIRRGVQNEGARSAPSRATLQLNNGASNVAAGESGRYSPRNPRSDLFGKIGRNTPIRISAGLEGGAQSIRFVGEVVQWPARWDLSENDQWVNVEAAGILRRLGTPGRPLRSAPRRFLRGTDPVAYWPLTEVTSGVTLVGNALDPPQEAAATWRSEPLADWLERGLRLSPRQEASIGSVFDQVRGASLDSDPSDELVVEFVYRRLDHRNTRLRLELESGDSSANELSWSVLLGQQESDSSLAGPEDIGARLQFFIGGSGNTFSTTTEMPETLDREFHHVRLSVVDNGGGNTEARVWFDGVEVSFDVSTNSGMARQSFHQPVLSWWASSTGGSSNSFDPPGEVLVGHFVSWAGNAPAIADTADAAFGHVGETAGRRVERLCSEESVAFTSTGDLDETIAMGPQHPRQFLSLLDEAADTEAAGSRLPILVEQREANGLHFNTRKSFHITS